MNYVEFHFGDYAKDTRHLSLIEHGAYRQLIDLYYITEKPLPADDLAKLVGARSASEKRALTNVTRQFFELCENAYRHEGCEKRIAKFKAKQAKARASAALGVKAREEKAALEIERSLSVRSTDGTAYPVTSNQSPVTIKDKRLSPAPQAHSSANAEEPGLELTGEPIKRANGSTPDCPYSAIAEAYHEELPELPSIVVLSPLRKRTLQARWREVCTAEHFNAEQGIEFFRDFFRRIKSSDFLIGKAPPKPGGRSFRADFDWILNPANFVKIVEGRYHGRRH